MDFIEFYARQVLWRRVFLICSIVFFCLTVTFAVLWVFTPEPKKDIDFLKEYIYRRYNFTPSTVRDAYYNPLQYRTLVYDTAVQPEISEILRLRLYSFFIVDEIEKNLNGFKVRGRKIVFKMDTQNTATLIKDEGIELNIAKAKGNKFYEK